MVQTLGKQNKKVPILMGQVEIKAIETLINTREQCGIKAGNKFVFANSAEGHQDSWKVLQKVARMAKCKNPALLSSTRLRKYLATVCQVNTSCSIHVLG